jgi:fumarate reductase flavoprotein subunit
MDGAQQTYTARHGVVLAAGDYANSGKLIARFKGEQFAEIEGINPRSEGDGHILAESVGAKLVNMDVTYGPEIRFVPPKAKTFQQLLPTHGPLARLMGIVVPHMPQFVMSAMIRRLLVTWQHPENAILDDGAILLNQHGKRFCDETLTPGREIAIAKQPGKICYILLDGRLMERYSQWPHFISTAPKIGYAYAKDYLKLRPDVAVSAGSLEEVAVKRGLPTNTTVQTVNNSNQEKNDSGRPGLTKSPWLLLGPAKAYFTTTEGGTAINKQFKVLDSDHNPIPGLYAVGQNGLGGQILWGHGLHICWAITSGRMVGTVFAQTELKT